MAATNADVARVLNELVVLATLDEGSPQAFRVRAYENAAQAVSDYTGDITQLDTKELTKLKGVGGSTAAKIREYVDTGTFSKLEELRKKYPPELVEMTRIPGLGPKTITMLRDRLGVENLDQLNKAVAAQAVRELPGMGAKSEEKIGKAISRLGLHGKDRRTPIAQALPLARSIVAQLEEVPKVAAVQYCGSLRRFSETIGDVDILVSSTDAAAVMDRFVSMAAVDEVLAHGDTKSAVMAGGIQVDLRVVTPAEFGAAILYFTGSKAHNIALRQLALGKGWTLNEYALSEIETGKVVAAKTEASIYRKLGMAFVPPEMREDSGEIEAALAKRLPKPVELDDIKGDLHIHTNLSGDGRTSLDKMLAAAAARSLEYIAITDHGENLTINGVSRDKMLRQRKRLETLAARFPDMSLLHGSELNIAPDGSLDYDDKFLAGFDWCVASVHSSFDLERGVQTARVVAAIRHPAVSVIGHLTGRMIGRRPGIELDFDAVLNAAAETGTAIEINGALDRLDAPSHVIRQGAEMGVTFVISTDAHHPREFSRAHWGVANARRGWLPATSVANTWTRQRFFAWKEQVRSGKS
ncbi:MAG: DNA polymerase/3'-5' exonuclease PolX [Acidimicrobiia bacterium]|nr:DNA polymerase/3'-5' exonuclease PolX [Acidimicrobiia bacterium]